MATELKPASLDFGAIIAFVAPGFLALIALSYHVPMVTSWMNLAASVDQGIGVFLFVLLASISLGVAVSGVRCLIIDAVLLKWLPRRLRVPTPEIHWERMTSEQLTKVVMLKDNHYRYYQFYANTAVSLLLVWISAALAPTRIGSLGATVTLILALLALLWSAWDAFSRYGRGIKQLFPKPGKELT